ncbi:MAG: hypothetical protein AAF632_13890 [Bacteroidota bacterium]
MNEILIITGACGVGKSTVAKAWAKRKSGVAIETDYFTEWIYNDNFERFTQSEERLAANLAFVMAKEYLELKMPVAIEGVWSPYGFNLLRTRFEKEVINSSLRFVWLHCEINENHRRDELRIPEDQMKDRVDIVHGEQSSHRWDHWVYPLDTTHLSISETVNHTEFIAPMIFDQK